MELASRLKLDERLAGIGREDFPPLLRVRQTFPRAAEPDLAAAVRREMAPLPGRAGAGRRIVEPRAA